MNYGTQTACLPSIFGVEQSPDVAAMGMCLVTGDSQMPYDIFLVGQRHGQEHFRHLHGTKTTSV